MSNYIGSQENRFYVATEGQYGVPAAVQATNRFQAISLRCHQSLPVSLRRDKTGARTYLGASASAPRTTSFAVTTNLTSWDDITSPSLSPLVQAAMGIAPTLIQGLTVGAVSGGQLQTQSPHNLIKGSAIASNGEIRFVTTVPDEYTVTLNAPFSTSPSGGVTLSTTLCYQLGTQLSSVSIYDYWDPSNGVNRLLTGAGVNAFQINITGDTHELSFSGPASDLLDSQSETFGISGLSSFPAEPVLSAFDYSIVAGELGQAWLGSPLNQAFTLTGAAIEIKNNLLTRNQEFGSSYPMAIVPGPREVLASFTLFAQADANTTSIYSSAKTRTPISAMLQLGNQTSQMMAVYLPKVVPELPFYDDSESYLLWSFKNDLAQGVTNDEAYLAFS